MQKLVCAALGFAIAVILSTSAHTQNLQLEPVSVAFQPGQLATTLTVKNRSAVASSVQIRPFRWSQSGGEDVLLPTDLLAVSPPIVRIEPGQTQTFRLVLRHPTVGDEACFRVLLDELPSASSPGSVRIALRLSVPVFAPALPQRPGTLSWRVGHDERGPFLAAHNQGGNHVRVLNLRLTTAAGSAVPVRSGQLPYVLPKAEQIWQLERSGPVQAGAPMRVSAISDAGPITGSVRVDGR